MTKAFDDVLYQSSDGLRLYARDYRNDQAKHTLLCMHGLSRNSADFAALCEHMADDYRIVAVDQRGRGRSDYDSSPDNYQLGVYVQDMFTLIEHLELQQPVLIGTSMGGLIAMLMQATQPGRFAGLILNDIGPVVNPAGLQRIKGYVGKIGPVNSWEEAARQVEMINKAAFPNFQRQDWEDFARNMYGEDDKGVPVLLYDPAIAKPMDEDNTDAVAPELWPVFDAALSTPLLLVRGELSDILAPDCVREMQARHADMHYVEVADVGHAPVLDEPQAVQAIKEFLSALAPHSTSSP